MVKKSNEENYRDSLLRSLSEVEDTYYSFDETSELRRFIENYNPENDYSKICLSWNGERGEDFRDSSQEFRDKVSIYICIHNNLKLPQLLLRDLIQEIGKASMDSWGAPEYLLILSELLLKETKGKYVETFGEMLFRNMDTYGACICMDFSDINVKEILGELRDKQTKDKLVIDLIGYFESKL